jgi:hypothetical protein
LREFDDEYADNECAARENVDSDAAVRGSNPEPVSWRRQRGHLRAE